MATVTSTTRNSIHLCTPSTLISPLVAGVLGLALSLRSGSAQIDQALDTNQLPSQPYHIPGTVVVGHGAAQARAGGSTTVLAGENLEARNIVSASDLSGVAPNFAAFSGFSERMPRFEIRGLRENGLTLGEPTVTLYVDDVPYDELFSRGIPFFDTESIEILRGPQGTLFGASRPGGIINVHTPLPNNRYEGHALARYGSYNTVQSEIGASGPILNDALYAGLAGLYSRRDGYVHNITTGKDSDTREAISGRSALRWTPVDPLDITLTLAGYQFNDGMLPAEPLGQDMLTTSRNLDGYDHQSDHTESLRAAWSGESLKLISVTAFSGWHESLLQDGDFGPDDLVRADVAAHVERFSQELRVASLDSAASLRWAAGGYLSDKRFHTATDQIYNFGPVPLSSRSSQDDHDQNYAAFGQATYSPHTKVELTGGLRFEYDTRHSIENGADELAGGPGTPVLTQSHGAQSFHSFQPKVEAAWRPTAHTRAWASVARGFSPGGFNSSSGPTLDSFKDSDSWHCEIGARWQHQPTIAEPGAPAPGGDSANPQIAAAPFWASAESGQYSAAIAAFYNDVRDFQDLRPTQFGGFTMLNAASAHTVGVEAEVSARPVPQWELSVSAGWTDAVFDEFTDTSNGADLDGKTINFVPEYTVDAALTWHPFGGVFARVDAQGIGSFWLDDANTYQQSAYWLLNARVGWQGPHFGAALFGRNLLDARYITSTIEFKTPQDFFAVTPGEPLVVGFELSARF